MTPDDLTRDRTLPNEARPHGVPEDWGWPCGPIPQAGNNPGSSNRILPWFTAHRARTGSADGTPGVSADTNTRVHVRNILLRVFSARRKAWTGGAFTTDATASLYAEDFVGDVNRPVVLRPEPGGGVSALVDPGWALHGWLDPASFPDMSPIDPTDVGGIIVTLDMRLVPDEGAKPDDRWMAQYIGQAGADYWRAPNYNPAPPDHKGVAIGRGKRIVNDWRSFGMTTCTAEQLAAHPPP